MGLALLLPACGGRVIDDSGSGDPSPSGWDSGSNAHGSGGKPSRSGPTTSLPTKKLGDCNPGFKRAENPGLPCRWLTESGLCFEDTDAACACICPTDRDSICAHAFDGGPNDAKLVVCD